jgi:hypothetical protein
LMSLYAEYKNFKSLLPFASTPFFGYVAILT